MHEIPVTSLSSRFAPSREQGSSFTPAPPVDERDTYRVGQNRSAFQPVHIVVLVPRTCGAEKLRFLFVTPLASHKQSD